MARPVLRNQGEADPTNKRDAGRPWAHTQGEQRLRAL